jgi:putative iron-only hydrogenase system regulator
MEKRVGVIAVLVTDKESVYQINTLLTQYGSLIRGRLGLPMPEKGISVISLIIEGTTDDIGALTGKIGRLSGVEVKSTLTRYRGDENEHSGS